MITYRRRQLGMTPAEAAPHWWVWLGLGLIGGFSIGWLMRQHIRD